MSKRLRFGRRAFLGGAAAAVTLPMLEAAVSPARLFTTPTAKAGSEMPTRLVFVHVPNGMIRQKMRPAEVGRGYTMPELLRSLEDVRNDFSILTGISNKPGGGYYVYPDGTVSDDGPGDHARDTATFLTATRIRKTDGSDIQNGISVDQVAANYLRDVTPDLPSLELSTRQGTWGGDSGYAPIYKANISWSSPTTPMAKETDPGAVFDRLFGGFDPGASLEEQMRRQRLEQSVLDYVFEDVRLLNGRLGTNDRQKLDEYLTSVRQLELRIQGMATGPSCDPGVRPGSPSSFADHADMMFELIKLAFMCDRTRVVTLMLDSSSGYDFLDVDGSSITGDHHAISHLDNGAADVRRIEEINRWQMTQFGSLLRKLGGATDTDGTSVLHNSLVLFGGGLDGTGHNRDDETLTPQPSGSVHRHTDLPLFLGGRGGGAVASGRHIVWTEQEPVADLFLSMLHTVGVPDDSFGIEGTGPISQLAG